MAYYKEGQQPCLVLMSLMAEIGVSAQTGSVPKSNADLALNVLQGLQNEGKTNPFFSPTSVFYGLSMLYYGMGDTSRNVMSSSLNLPNSKEKLSDELKVRNMRYHFSHFNYIIVLQG